MYDELFAKEFISVSDQRREFLPLDRDLFLPSLREHYGQLEAIRGKKFLDVGSGVGSPLQDLLEELGVKVIRLDKSSAVMERLRAEKKLAIQGSFLDLPFKPDSFDGVIQSEVINGVSGRHSPEYRRWLPRMFTEIYRVITPGGIFIQTHNGDCVGCMPDAKLQLQLLAWTGFRDIHLVGRKPQIITSLSFLATRGNQHYLLTDVLKSNFDEVYGEAEGYGPNLGI